MSDNKRKAEDVSGYEIIGHYAPDDSREAGAISCLIGGGPMPLGEVFLLARTVFEEWRERLWGYIIDPGLEFDDDVRTAGVSAVVGLIRVGRMLQDQQLLSMVGDADGYRHWRESLKAVLAQALIDAETLLYAVSEQREEM